MEVNAVLGVEMEMTSAPEAHLNFWLVLITRNYISAISTPLPNAMFNCRSTATGAEASSSGPRTSSL